MSSKIALIATKTDQKDKAVTDTQAEMVSAPGPKLRRAPRWWGSLALLGGLAVPVWLTTQVVTFVPDAEQGYAFMPGSASSGENVVTTGALEGYDAKGDVYFVTISLQRLNQVTRALADDEAAIDLKTRKEAIGDKSRAEDRKEDLKLMQYSKDFAAFVALRHLGYSVKVTGGGVAVRDLYCVTFAADKTCSEKAPAVKVLKPNDVIVAVEGTQTPTSFELSAALRDRTASGPVNVTIQRAGESGLIDVDVEPVTVGGRVILGIVPNSAPPDTIRFDLPEGVGIDSGDVGGPSAGLAFTLSLLDRLTPGELTGGVRVAATGTISLSTAVGEIGGLRQKTVAVQRSGAKVFLVPESQKAEAEQEAAGSDLKVIGVRSLDDALRVLAELGGNAADLGRPGATASG